MSWPALKWALLKRLPAPQKSTLITLARRDPKLDVHLDTLADEAGLSRSGTRLAIAGLETSKLLTVERRTNRPNRFVLNLQCATHDVSAYEVSAQDVSADGSRGECSATHEVTTNRDRDKQVKTDTLSRSREKATNPRFQEFLSELKDYWTAANPGIPFDFSPKDGKALNGLLSSKKSLERPLFRTCLENRFHSDDVNHCQEFHTWILQVTKYAKEPLNKYGQPKGASNAATQGSTARQTTAERNGAFSKQSIGDAVADLFGQGFGRSDESDGELLRTPADCQGNGESVDGAMGGIDTNLWPRGFSGRTLQGRP